MILRAINTLKVLSLLAFLMMLLWIYAYFAEDVKLFLPGDPVHFMEMTKSRFFYIFLFTFTGINLFLYWFTFFIKNSVGVPNIIRALKNDHKLNVFISWLGAFHFSLNILLLGVLFYTGLQNINNHAAPGQYNSLLILGSFLTLLCIAGMLISVVKHEAAEK